MIKVLRLKDWGEMREKNVKMEIDVQAVLTTTAIPRRMVIPAFATIAIDLNWN